MTTASGDTIDRFAADWAGCLHDRGLTPPDLADYLPDGAAIRLAILAELVRIDLRHRWEHAGPGRRIPEYCREFPELEHSRELIALLCAEFHARRRTHGITIDEFLAEYPDSAEEIRAEIGAFALAGFEMDAALRAETAAAVADLVPGQRIDEFDLLTDLGSGTLGRVFLARQRSMQRLVAVRISERAGAPYTMAQLDHPHIVRVFDQRVGAQAAPRLVYMQYLPGGTAAGVLEQRGAGPVSDGGALLLRAVDSVMAARGDIRATDSSVRTEIAALSWPETVAWLGRRLADALDYAHRSGVLHLGIKPENVLFTAEGIPKLADFTLHDPPPSTAPADSIAAQHDRLRYQSPEQLAAELDPAAPAADTRSDIYALGVLLWQLLTGATPFEDADTAARAVERRRGGVSAAALERIPPDCPAALRRVLLTCLEFDRDRRWHDGAMLAQQLDLCLDPHARDLVDPPERSWRRRLRAWRIPIVTLAILVPNILASLYNIEHDTKLIQDKLTEQTQQRFEVASTVVNSVGFSTGAILLLFFSRYMLFVPGGLGAGVSYRATTLQRARTAAVLLGDRALLVILSLWTLSGIAFPVILYGTPDSVSPYDYTHYVASHLVCGVVALIYPFFLVNLYMIRCIHPMFLSHSWTGEQDAARLHRLRGRCARYLIVAASIPLLAVAGATLLSPADLNELIVEVRILSLGSIFAFVGTYFIFRTLERDLDALERVLAPTSRSGGAGSATLPG